MAVKSLGITTANSKKKNLEQRIKALQKQQELEDRKLNEKVAKSLMEQLPKIGVAIHSDDDLYMVLGALLLIKERNEFDLAIQKGQELYTSRNNKINVEHLDDTSKEDDVMDHD